LDAPSWPDEPSPEPDGADFAARLAADAELSGSGVPGRTRPLFEELPPGPPTAPAWAAIAVGVVGLAFGLVAAQSVVAGAVTSLGGGVLLTAGLVWLAVAAIIRRRELPANRYRGPSVILLFVLVLIGASLVFTPILLWLLRGDIGRIDDPDVVSVELLLSPVAFLAILAAFVAWPRALAGIRLWRGRSGWGQLASGAAMGLLVWIAMQLLAGAIALVLEQFGVNLGGEQEVAGLALKVPVVVGVLAIVLLSPVAEELFFRGLAFNAWEREYGTQRAIFGSALLFSLAHVPGGTALAVLLVFLLGLVLSFVYARSRSLLTTIGLHACFNLATLAVLVLAGGAA
jgi:membrane protease YdiL (CAAX protease family)